MRKSLFGGSSFVEPSTPVSFRNSYRFNQPEEEEPSPFRSLGSRFNIQPELESRGVPDDYNLPSTGMAGRFSQDPTYGTPQSVVPQSPMQSYGRSRMDPFSGSSSEPDFSAMEAFKEYLSRAPSRSDYAPSFVNRLGAALSGFGVGLQDPAKGMAVVQSQLEQPFRRAQEEYQGEGERLGSLADIESSQNKGIFDRDKLRADYEAKLRDDAREDLRVEGDLDIRNRLANLEGRKFDYTQTRDKVEDQQFASKLAAEGWDKFTNSEGMAFMVNPITQEIRPLGASIDKAKLDVDIANSKSQRISAGASASQAAIAGRRLEEVEIPGAAQKIKEGDVGISETQARIDYLRGAKTNLTNAQGQAATSRARLTDEQVKLVAPTVEKINQQILESRERTRQMGKVDPDTEYGAEVNAANELMQTHPEYEGIYDPETRSINPAKWYNSYTEQEVKDFVAKLMEMKQTKINQKYGGVSDPVPNPRPDNNMNPNNRTPPRSVDFNSFKPR